MARFKTRRDFVLIFRFIKTNILKYSCFCKFNSCLRILNNSNKTCEIYQMLTCWLNSQFAWLSKISTTSKNPKHTTQIRHMINRCFIWNKDIEQIIITEHICSFKFTCHVFQRVCASHLYVLRDRPSREPCFQLYPVRWFQPYYPNTLGANLNYLHAHIRTCHAITILLDTCRSIVILAYTCQDIILPTYIWRGTAVPQYWHPCVTVSCHTVTILTAACLGIAMSTGAYSGTTIIITDTYHGIAILTDMSCWMGLSVPLFAASCMGLSMDSACSATEKHTHFTSTQETYCVFKTRVLWEWCLLIQLTNSEWYVVV